MMQWILLASDAEHVDSATGSSVSVRGREPRHPACVLLRCAAATRRRRRRAFLARAPYYYYYSLLSPGGKVGRFALPVSGARARLGGGRRVLLLAGSGGVCPRFRARGGLSCSL